MRAPSSPTVALCILSDRPAHLHVLLGCLRLQTWAAWQAIVLDQTPDGRCRDEVALAHDARLEWRQVPYRGDWGQGEKFAAAQSVQAEFVGVPNDDSYYCPRYLELMMAHAVAERADLVYCDWVSAWDAGRPYIPYTARPQIGQIDVGGFLVRRTLLLSHGWPDRGPTGDGVLVESLVRHGARVAHVPATLYVKN